MKNLLILTFLFCGETFGSLQAQTASDLDMQVFARNFMNAYNQQDAAAMQKMYLADAVRVDQAGKELKGADQIAAFFAEQFKLNNATVFVRQNSVHWSDFQHAWLARGTYEVNGSTHASNQPVHFTGGYENTMFQVNGQWKIGKSIHTPVAHIDPKVAANIEMYTEVWDRIVNEGELELFNDKYFTEDVVRYAEPENVVGIEAMKAYYKNFITGFSDIKFAINNVFGEGDQLVKHWTFMGKHTGKFFGIPATGYDVNVEGVTLVKMKDGKIAQEQDFMDNLAFMRQLGVIPVD